MRSRVRCSGNGFFTGRLRSKLEGGDTGRPGRRRFGGKVNFAGCGLEFLELQFKLVQEPAAALGAGAILLAPELGDLQLEVPDQSFPGRRLSPRGGKFGAHRNNQGLKRFDIVRQGLNGGFHDRNESAHCLSVQPKNAALAEEIRVLSRAHRTPAVLRVAPVNPVEQTRQLSARQRHCTVFHLGPNEAALLEPLGIKRHTDPVMPDVFTSDPARPRKT